jgi:hypothetical protein
MMSTETVTQVVERLLQAGPLTAEGFTARLAAPLTAGERNPFWHTYTFALAEGPFGGGEVRVNSTGDGALVILKPRDPAGLGAEAVDRAALGARLGMRPNLRLPPEGVETEYFDKDGVEVATQWMRTSRRLRRLVLKWGGEDDKVSG